MTAQILDGKALAATIKAELTERVAALAERGITPGLGTVLVGDDPGSHSYVRGKHRDCAQVGIASIQVELPASTSAAELHAKIAELNADPACTGYIVQLPLPGSLDEFAALLAVDPDKDADGLHPVNLGRLVLGRARAAAVHAARRGRAAAPQRHPARRRGRLRDRPRHHGGPAARPAADPARARTPRSRSATPAPPTWPQHTRQADIVVAAAGRPGLVTADMVKPGAVCVDVGITRTEAGPGR